MNARGRRLAAKPKCYTTAGVMAGLAALARAGNQVAADFLASIQVKASDMALASDGARAADIAEASAVLAEAPPGPRCIALVSNATLAAFAGEASNTVPASNLVAASNTVEASNIVKAPNATALVLASNTPLARRRARKLRYENSPKGKAARAIRRATR